MTSVIPAKAGIQLAEGDLFHVARACLDANTIEAKLDRTLGAAGAFSRSELSIPADAPPPDPIAMPGRPARSGPG